METKTGADAPLALSVKSFCARNGVSASTFWKWLKEGRVRAVKVGGRRLIPASEVARLFPSEAA